MRVAPTTCVPAFGLAIVSLACIGCDASPTRVPASKPVSVHPVFHTPVSGRIASKPAVFVDVHNDTELGGLGTAELYLSVQSSRFPSDVHVLLPINCQDFRGCKYRYIQMPFEVEAGDNLGFDLLDDNSLSEDQEKLILDACKVSGFCVQIGVDIVRPDLAWIADSASVVASELTAHSVVLTLRDSPFRNFGKATFIAQTGLPKSPQEANPLELLDSNMYSRASVRVYFPDSELSFSLTAK